MALPGFNEQKQILLQKAKVLIVGAGGLGCPVAQYLAATGVGTIGIADFDTISVSNLHRQILYTPMEVGMQKAIVTCNKLQEQNPAICLIPHCVRITHNNVLDFVNQYDIIVDGTDNFDTKYLLNDACVIAGKPLVYGSIYQYEGQVAVWNSMNKDGSRTPNYRDLYPEINAATIPDCAEGGVIPALAGIIGCMQANEVIKIITNTGELLAGKLLIFDALTMQSHQFFIGNVTNTQITNLVHSVSVPTISCKEFKTLVTKGDYVLVDVRKKEERALFHIGGMHIPLAELEMHIEKLNTSLPVIIYCASGKRSAEAVKTVLKQLPKLSIYSLNGGTKAWQEEM